MAGYKPSDRHRERDRNKRGRTLSLRLEVRSVPRGTKRSEVINRLLESIADGSYELPSGWDIEIHWKNGPKVPWRSDSWYGAMTDSAESSRGWERAVIAYLQASRYKGRPEA